MDRFDQVVLPGCQFPVQIGVRQIGREQPLRAVIDEFTTATGEVTIEQSIVTKSLRLRVRLIEAER